MIIDASVILKGFFPDEEGHAQAQARISGFGRGKRAQADHGRSSPV